MLNVGRILDAVGLCFPVLLRINISRHHKNYTPTPKLPKVICFRDVVQSEPNSRKTRKYQERNAVKTKETKCCFGNIVTAVVANRNEIQSAPSNTMATQRLRRCGDGSVCCLDVLSEPQSLLTPTKKILLALFFRFSQTLSCSSDVARICSSSSSNRWEPLC